MHRCSIFVTLLLSSLLFHAHLKAQERWETVYPSKLQVLRFASVGDSIVAVINGTLCIADANGETWRNIGGFQPKITDIASDGQRIFLASDDAGVLVREPGDEQFRKLRVDTVKYYGAITRGDTVFVNTKDAVYTSVDHGATLQRVSGTIAIKKLLFPGLSSLFALFADNKLYRSDDDGASWNVCSSPPFIEVPQFVFHKGKVFRAARRSPALQVSADLGNSWTPLPGLPVDTRINQFGLYLQGISSITADDEALFITTGRGVFRSIDEGGSWEQLSIGDVRFTALFKARAALLAYGSNGIFRHAPVEQHWKLLPAFYFGASPVLIAGGRCLIDRTGRFSPDEGSTWWADTYTHEVIAGRPDGILYRGGQLSYDSGYVMLSADNGMSWSFVDSLPPAIPTIAANNDYIVLYYRVGSIASVMLSSNGGTAWRELYSTDSPTSQVAELTINQAHHILVHFSDRWLFSDDLGQHWDSLHASLPDPILRGVMTQHAVFVETVRGIFKRRSDGGWQDMQASAIDPEATIAGTWKQYLCLFGNDRLHFIHDEHDTRTSLAMPDPFVGQHRQLGFVSTASNVFLTPGFNGMVYRHRIDGILTVGIDQESLLPANAGLREVFPHPASGRAQFEIHVGCTGFLTAVIVDMLGRTAQPLFQGTLERGVHTISGNLSNLSAGTYLLRLRTASGQSIHPIIVAR